MRYVVKINQNETIDCFGNDKEFAEEYVQNYKECMPSVDARIEQI